MSFPTIDNHSVHLDMLDHSKVSHQFTTEASLIGLEPGVWPKSLKVEPEPGNANLFVMTRMERDASGIVFVEYEQLYGCLTVVVFND